MLATSSRIAFFQAGYASSIPVTRSTSAQFQPLDCVVSTERRQFDPLAPSGDPPAVGLNPTLADAATNLFGPVAIATSGGWINDPYEADQATIAVESNFTIDGVDFLDDCSGHFNLMGYHDHGIRYCLTAEIDTTGQHSALLGFAADGFPVYGPQGTDGSEVADLDDCRGEFGPTPEFPDGVYHYHLTTVFPYTTLCLSGTVAESAHAGH